MGNPYLPLTVTVEDIRVENNAKDLKTFTLGLNGATFDYTCGQFAELSVWGAGECPIGIASSPMDDGFLQFTVKRMGIVTSSLHSSQVGDKIGVRGPYGNGFPMDMLRGSNIVIVAGGFAFTTLRSLTNYILHPDNRGDFGKLTIVYGAREPGELIYKYDLEAWGQRDDIDLHVTVDGADDGWTGLVGYVPTILGQVAPSAENAVAVVCGPPVMIRFSIPVLYEAGFSPNKILNSLEMRMKCGLGKCGRCNIGSKYVCRDGPVFTFAELQEMPAEY